MITLVRSILSAVSEGVIKRFSGGGRPGETFTSRELFQHYGFTSRPKAGAEGLVLVQGNAVFCFASDDRRYRLEISEGEVALYTDEGDYIHFKRGRELQVLTQTLKASVLGAADITAGTSITAAAPTVSISATTVNLACSQLNMSPPAGGGTPVGAIQGAITITGTLTVSGALSAASLAVSGNITAGGSITDTGGNTNHHSHG